MHAIIAILSFFSGVVGDILVGVACMLFGFMATVAIIAITISGRSLAQGVRESAIVKNMQQNPEKIVDAFMVVLFFWIIGRIFNSKFPTEVS